MSPCRRNRRVIATCGAGRSVDSSVQRRDRQQFIHHPLQHGLAPLAIMSIVKIGYVQPLGFTEDFSDKHSGAIAFPFARLRLAHFNFSSLRPALPMNDRAGVSPGAGAP